MATPHEGDRRVAVVTGSSRGAGKGIALALADRGYAVVVTGRTARNTGHPLGGSVDETAAAVTARGGLGVGMLCDHGDDGQVARLVSEVRRRFGRIDLLVNNALALPEDITDPEPFWEKSLGQLSMVEVGLRSSYVMTYHAAPLMLDAARSPLVVMTSGFGARCYLHGPAYGAVKAGIDKMAHDMAIDFRPEGVAVVSLWLGLLRSERTGDVAAAADRYPAGDAPLPSESPEYVGRVIAALDADPGKLDRSGEVLISAELGAELGVLDVDGQAPASRRDRLGGPPAFHPAVVR